MSRKLNRKFEPAWWLSNRHLQSCFNTVFQPPARTVVRWEQLELPDGDFVDLCWAGANDAPIVILLHGLEGSVDSPYIQLMLDALVEDNWQVVVMHFRTCSGRLNRLSRAYHAGDINDLSYLIRVVTIRYPETPISAVGFSLGGNVLLHYLTQNPEAPICRAVAVSVPFELNKCSDYLAQFYHWMMLHTMKNKTIAKVKAGYDMPVDLREINAINDFRGFDERITAPLHGFSGADEYYERVTIRHLLKNILHPTLIIHALDDPLVPSECIPASAELSNSIVLELSEKGGHVGFVQGALPWQPKCWLKDRILDFLKKSV